MADKEARKTQAEKHNALMKSTFASETAATVEAAVIYEEGEGRSLPLPEAPFEATETIVTRAFIPEAFYRFGKGKTLVVDPATFTRPGGGYLDGAAAPEQVICADSNLFEALCGIRTVFHAKNRDYVRGTLFTDRAAYLPGIAFSRGGDVRTADVLAIAEPMRVRALERHRPEAECDHELERRIETILRIAAVNGCETVVCNGFACGRLGYPVQQVVDVFAAWLDEHPGAIGRIVFAVPRFCFDAFNEAFGKRQEDKPAPVAVDEDESWRTIELPEGITIR